MVLLVGAGDFNGVDTPILAGVAVWAETAASAVCTPADELDAEPPPAPAFVDNEELAEGLLPDEPDEHAVADAASATSAPASISLRFLRDGVVAVALMCPPYVRH
jgi:hypothetical protein